MDISKHYPLVWLETPGWRHSFVLPANLLKAHSALPSRTGRAGQEEWCQGWAKREIFLRESGAGEVFSFSLPKTLVSNSEFFWFSYNKRFPLPLVLQSVAVCTLSNSCKELCEQPHISSCDK